MEIALPSDLELYVREQVAGGSYDSADEVVQAALRQMRDRASKRAEIRKGFLEEDAEMAAGLLRG